MELNQLLEFLNLSDKDGLFFYDDLRNKKTGFLSIRLKEVFCESVKPDAFFCINNEPLILFFEKKRNLERLEKQIWNLNQSPAIFINDGNQWLIKNGFKFLKSTERLETLTPNKNISDFEYFELITGKSWEKYKKDFEQKNRVDSYLLKNIEDARGVLINIGKLHPKVANSLIGRVIFIRYLIDRNVELNVYGITKKEDFYEILDDKEKAYNFFQQVKDDFNGNLFPLKHSIDGIEILEKEKINDSHLLKIKELLQGGKIYKDGSHQPSFFDIYDFSIIPIEFISNVYEKFIGVEKQAGTGAYYTPLFLVDYIQKETVSKYFKGNPNHYNCKVLDPACGSGIFLVETLRQIIFQYQKNNPEYFKEENHEEYKKTLKRLLKDNIFGVDKDENAISVAIFSLYITLLDNLTPKSIVGFRFPELIGTNFFTNDFFDIQKPFNTELKKHHFRFILGNPPWATKHPKEKQLFEKYIENRKKRENSTLEIENREIAEAFLVRVSDFDFEEVALIVVSKVLYKISRKKEKRGVFRKYFLNRFKVRQVFELSSVRHQVFDKSNDKAVAPATILFYAKGNEENNLKKNIIKHISLKPNIFFETFKLMVIEKYDVKEISQNYFVDDDWLWKVLVYGNILDYYFIKRLKNHKSIYEYISDKKQFLFGKGISVGGGDKNPIDEHKKINYSINSKQKGLKSFVVNYTSNFLSNLDFVHRQRKIDLFKSPVLLVGKGVSNDFKLKSSISLYDVIYTDAITGIKPLTDKAKEIIYLLEALFNSGLFSYFLVNTNSSIGIEREQSHDREDKFSIPLLIAGNIDVLKARIEELKKLSHKLERSDFQTFEKQTIVQRVFVLQNTLEIILMELYEVSNQEKSLIDYTNNVTIPLLKGNDTQSKKVIDKLKYKSEVLNEYAKIFIEHFSKRFNSNGHFFEVEIIFSNHTILMKFKIISQPSKHTNCIEWSKDGDKNLLITLAQLGFENLSDNLYLQKDIKGFEEDYFYVAKPNQYKSWHPALAYLDLSEFIEAFFKIDNEKM
ncbi:MAG: N-6 DNA methylase [Flavobacteriaceae bacterium]|jgi:hypothetical protein|nr:N-6 DNA methylase [Flavobacteriaceae bacterium]